MKQETQLKKDEKRLEIYFGKLVNDPFLDFMVFGRDHFGDWI